MRITYLEDDFLGVETGNNREVESSLRDLPSSRWVASENRWEVHLCHLPDLISLFRLKTERIPEQLMTRFQREWLSTDVRLEIEHSHCRVLGAGVPTRDIDSATSFDVAERTEDSAYLEGEWDGRRHLFDRRAFSFPTGLLTEIESILRDRKLRVAVVDKREPFEPTRPLPAKFLDPLTPADRELVEAVRTQGRVTAVREALEGGTALTRAVIEAAGPTGVILAANQADAEDIAARLGEDCARPYRTLKDLDAPRLVLPVADAAALFSHMEREGGQRIPLPPEDKRKALMIGLRLRREHAIIVPRSSIIDGDLLYRAAMGATNAAVRVAISRTPARGDGRDLLLAAAFGPWRRFVSAAARVQAGEIPPVRLFRIRAPEYRRVERDKPYDVIVRNGLFKNESRMEIISGIIDAERAAGRHVLVTARNEEFRAALAALAGDRADVMPAIVATVAISEPEDPSRPVPGTVVFAEPVSEPGVAIRLLLAVSEAHAALARRGGEGAPFVHVYDFDDPLAGLRRRNEARFAVYARLTGWVDEYVPGKAPRPMPRPPEPQKSAKPAAPRQGAKSRRAMPRRSR